MNTENRRQKSIKVIDHRPHDKRKNELYGILGQCGIFPGKMHKGKGVFYTIINEDDVENILKEENVQKARDKGFKILAPIEFGAMKTIVIKQVDEMINDYNNEEIKESIEHLNEWARVQEIYKFGTTSKMLKVRFTDTAMVKKAENQGILVLNQRINPRRIEREIFIKINACNNFFRYYHDTKRCDMDDG